MFGRLMTRPVLSQPPRHYKQRIAPDAQSLPQNASVYVTLRTTAGVSIESVRCELQRAESIGKLLWACHVPESAGPEILDHEVIIQQDRRQPRHRLRITL